MYMEIMENLIVNALQSIKNQIYIYMPEIHCTKLQRQCKTMLHKNVT